MSDKLKNIYNAINNLYNMDFNTWQEVIAMLYNIVADVEQKFEVFESKFEIALGEEVTGYIKELINNGEIGELINEKLLNDILVKIKTLDNRVGNILAHNGNGEKDTEIIDGRGDNICLGDRFIKIENGNGIKEITFDKIKSFPTEPLTFPIANFNNWKKWSATEGDENKILSLDNGGIQVVINSPLKSNLVMSKSGVNLQGKKLTLKFVITVNSIVNDNDRFTIALNDTITLKSILLKDYVIGKPTTISIDLNNEKFKTGSLSMVYNNTCNCKLENIRLCEYVNTNKYPFKDFTEFMQKIKDGSYISELSFDKIKSVTTNDKLFSINSFSKWSKWSATEGDVNKITNSNEGITVNIDRPLLSNLVVSQKGVNFQNKKITLKFDIIVNSIINNDDRFNVALNGNITLKTILLKDYPIGKPTSVLIHFNEDRLSTGNLSLVFSQSCHCSLDNLKLYEYNSNGNDEDYQSLIEVIDDVKTIKNEVKAIKNNTSSSKDFVLPNTVPVIKDFETNIFWDNTLLNTNINSIERIDVANSIGGRTNVLEDRWRMVIPTSGNVQQTFNVYFGDTSNVSKAIKSNIVVLEKTLGTGKVKRIIFIGDSLTDNNIYQKELIKLFENDNMKVELLGSRGSAPYRHEGRAGWTTKHYCTTNNFNGRDNAFYNPTTKKFDFTYYMQQQGYSGVDYVFINMGTNCLANDNIETLGYFKEMVNSIKKFNSNIVVFVGLCPPLSSRCDKYTLKNKRIELMKLLLNEFDNKQNERIIINPLVLNFDSKNGFPVETITGNRHTNENLQVVTDDTHPLVSEYYKMADTNYCSIKYAVSLGY